MSLESSAVFRMAGVVGKSEVGVFACVWQPRSPPFSEETHIDTGAVGFRTGAVGFGNWSCVLLGENAGCQDLRPMPGSKIQESARGRG